MLSKKADQGQEINVIYWFGEADNAIIECFRMIALNDPV